VVVAAVEPQIVAAFVVVVVPLSFVAVEPFVVVVFAALESFLLF
jgi:hypothetical protein